MYPKELDLIADIPSAVKVKWTDYLARIKDNVWDRQSIAMRIAMTALFMALLSVFVYLREDRIEGFTGGVDKLQA